MIKVPACCRNDQPLSHTRTATFRSDGNWYPGSSITNEGVRPRSKVRRSASATTIAATMPASVQGEQRDRLQPHPAAQVAVVRDESGDQQRVDLQPRTAGHQRRDQNRHQPVAPVFDRPRGHDAGHRAARTRTTAG